MLKISKLADYAVVIMSRLALAPDKRLSARTLAGLTQLNLPTVSKVLKRLAQASLVQSSRGTAGGYQLMRAPEQTSLVQIIAAIDGALGLTECARGSTCQHHACCQLKANWQVINSAIVNLLQSVSLAEMNRPLTQQHLKSEAIHG